MFHKYHIITPKSVLKTLDRMPLPWRERVLKVINRLQYDPLLGQIMSGIYRGQRKIKVRPYRILYMVDFKKKVIIIAEIAHRGNISYG